MWIDLLWLGLIALPVIAGMMWFESNILRGKWLEEADMGRARWNRNIDIIEVVQVLDEDGSEMELSEEERELISRTIQRLLEMDQETFDATMLELTSDVSSLDED